MTARKLEHTPYPVAAQQAGECSFLVPQLVQASSGTSAVVASSGQLAWSESLLWSLCCSAFLFSKGLSTFIPYSGGEWPSDSGQVPGLPEVSLSSLLSLRSFPAGCNVSVS